MIKKGTKLKIYPNYRYKDDPSKDVDILTGENSSGSYLQFQVMDVNRGKEGKTNTGFAYMRAFTNLPLKVGDMITVKELIGVLKKDKGYSKQVIIEVKIEETVPAAITINDEEQNEDGTYEY